MRPAVFALMLVVFSLTTGEFVIAGILPEVAAGLAVSMPAAGLLVSAYALGMIVGGPVVTVATSRLPRKPLVVGLVAVAQVALGMNLGIVGGTPIGAAVGQTFGWRATFVSVAVGAAVALLLLLRFLPTMPAQSSASARRELRVFADRRVQLAIVLTALGNVGVVTVFTYFTPRLPLS
ncbi:MFS transporter [Nocardia sp. CA-120079]|uniref:MFS transporter n=1 Tax=Nocardia sp. CA-120079 TaxID=3239974 RepID=UPI003D971177